ncbi:hypothetical protein POM88_010374 [Heracleum sosnowskyi]|uniref:Bidirectional sugar transporter SWEET n=1 Tax=Heracleum sosnowskyi TaxID=360622 RepID=A0AAD8IUK1_9APIA|nr:hypothetical protein POM88_010374 [Heracleum sosnowskyi]
MLLPFSFSTANVLSIGLFASAVPTFYRAVKRCDDSVEDINPYYFLAMTFNCLLWVLYGLPFIHPGNFLLLTAYGTGVTIHIAYLAIFLLYARRQRMCVVSVILIELLVIALVFGVVIGLNHTFDSRSFAVGFLMGTFGSGILVFRQRLATKVQDKKCAKWMPFLIALSETLNNLCWCIYAALGSDRYLTIITGIGFVMTLYQLIRYCVYRSCSTPKSCDDEKLPETADKEISQAEHDKKVAQAVHDKKLALQLEQEKIKQALMQALMLAQAQFAQVELDLAELGPVTGLDQDKLDIV